MGDGGMAGGGLAGRGGGGSTRAAISRERPPTRLLSAEVAPNASSQPIAKMMVATPAIIIHMASRDTFRLGGGRSRDSSRALSLCRSSADPLGFDLRGVRAFPPLSTSTRRDDAPMVRVCPRRRAAHLPYPTK